MYFDGMPAGDSSRLPHPRGWLCYVGQAVWKRLARAALSGGLGGSRAWELRRQGGARRLRRPPECMLQGGLSGLVLVLGDSDGLRAGMHTLPSAGLGARGGAGCAVACRVAGSVERHCAACLPPAAHIMRGAATLLISGGEGSR
jgi:hypothetical protein